MSAERQPVPNHIENLEDRTFFSVASISQTSVRFPRPLIAQRAKLLRAARITSTATAPTPSTSAQAGNWRGSNPFGILARFNRISGNWSSASPFSTIAQRIRA
jgi:hypothetical protein